MSLVRLIARPMLASIFVVQGVKNFRDPDPLVPGAKSVVERFGPMVERHAPDVPTEPRQLVRANAVTQFGAGLALATGKCPRLAALVLAGTLVPSTLANHAFWETEDPEQRNEQRVHALKNAGLAGGLLLASVDTEGKPGISWRARQAAGKARKVTKSGTRKARKAAKDARPS
ncbi:DoxX family protein [Actinobacteria bacterium YIM 96077]|uniref:DoxX family protein n=1 Tax=Phytoactinopolyspora halophila TaxID=1981511 RepID=A0A329R319_9ACTN|nr:DoxX family protein [Phytoactinopolyspora halophila]AYY11982.1 DoxX family protein [Actinobacteria bacterium YIM 96077]RAW18783.1 DoxX family protein [Phytoactinopolyspora halophila]